MENDVERKPNQMIVDKTFNKYRDSENQLKKMLKINI